MCAFQFNTHIPSWSSPDAIKGSSEALLVIVKRAALEERIAHRLAEAIDLAARDGHRLIPAITLNVTLCL